MNFQSFVIDPKDLDAIILAADALHILEPRIHIWNKVEPITGRVERHIGICAQNQVEPKETTSAIELVDAVAKLRVLLQSKLKKELNSLESRAKTIRDAIGSTDTTHLPSLSSNDLEDDEPVPVHVK